jgi:MarR family transcriptional regulator, organic hydroperoxide resistance regulator
VKATPPTAPAELDAVADAFEELLAAQRRLRGRDAKEFDGISLGQLRVLRVLQRDGAMPVNQLATAALASPPSVTQMLDALEERELVVRTRSDTDRRIVTVDLTPNGRSRAELRRAAVRAKLEQTFADVAPDDMANGAVILRRLAAYLDAL